MSSLRLRRTGQDESLLVSLHELWMWAVLVISAAENCTSSHLPECPHANSRTATFYGGYCVCPLLRACEQRVLDAAREAVAVVGVRKDTSYDMRVVALAAIDALREVKE